MEGILMAQFGLSDVEKLVEEKDVAGLIKALSYKDGNIRQLATEALGEIGDQRAVDPLIKKINDIDNVVGGKAAQALGKIGDTKAVGFLILALDKGDKVVRWYVAEALGKIGDPRAVEPLTKALNDSNNEVSKRAAEALEKIGAPAVEPLIKVLGDENEHVRKAAAETLGKIAPLNLRAKEALAEKKLKAEQTGSADAGAPATKTTLELIAELQTGEAKNALAAASRLADLGEPAVEALLEAVGDDGMRQRYQLLRSTGQWIESSDAGLLVMELSKRVLTQRGLINL